MGSEQGLSSDLATTSLVDRTRQTNATLEAVLAQLVILEKIYQVPVDGGGRTHSNGCFDYVTAVGPDTRAGAVSASAQVGVPERYRTVAVRPVFFDRGSRSLSDWARQDLAWFLGETQIPDGKLAIYGSTDPQGTATLNGVLARQRVEAIRSYVLEDAQLREVAPLEIISVRPSSDAGAPKSEPQARRFHPVVAAMPIEEAPYALLQGLPGPLSRQGLQRMRRPADENDGLRSIHPTSPSIERTATS